MAYDYLNDAMDESNRVQEDYQRRNPVIPNAPAPAAAPVYGDPGSGVAYPAGDQPAANPNGLRDVFQGVTGAIGRGMDAVMDVQGVRPAWQQPAAAPPAAPPNAVVAPSILQPRAAPDDAQPSGPQPASTGLPQGPISSAALAAPPDYIGAYNNPREADYARQNAAARASGKADFDARMDRQVASANAANAGTDLQRLQGEQRVARFRANNAALDVAGMIGGEGRYEAAALADKAAGRADSDVAAGKGAVTAANDAVGKAGQRDYLGDYVKTQAIEDQAARTKILASGARVDAQGRALDNQGKAIDNQGKQLTQAQAKQMNDLRAQLAAETDPKKAKALQDKLLAMQGHVPGKNVAIVDVDGPPDALGNPTKMKAAVNVDTGEFLQPPKNTSVAPPDNHVAALKANPKLAADFDAKYGKGAAAKILGN